jgi:hypothetical protein
MVERSVLQTAETAIKKKQKMRSLTLGRLDRGEVTKCKGAS